MKYFGRKETFALSYEFKKSPFESGKEEDFDWGVFQMWLENASICSFKRHNKTRDYEWNLNFIFEWLFKNRENIFNELQFPLHVEGITGLEFYNNSGNFYSDNDDEFYIWYEKRQKWYFRHSWFSYNSGSFLANVLFRRAKDNIEITWDNTNLFDEVVFLNQSGLSYVPLDYFKDVINGFIDDYKLSLIDTDRGKKFIQDLESEIPTGT